MLGETETALHRDILTLPHMVSVWVAAVAQSGEKTLLAQYPGLAAGPQRITHQDPGFSDMVANKSPSVVRIYLPPDANCLLSVSDHCFRSENSINVIFADKQPQDLQYLDMEAAIAHSTRAC